MIKAPESIINIIIETKKKNYLNLLQSAVIELVQIKHDPHHEYFEKWDKMGCQSCGIRMTEDGWLVVDDNEFFE